MKCADCGIIFADGDIITYGRYGSYCFSCIKHSKRENGLMIYHGDNYHYCLECKRAINYGDIITKGKWGYYCQQCSERKSMPNIKITAEVDGKQVPLETISTETFEAIKALEKPKKIPVARLGNFKGWPRLIFKPSRDIQLKVGYVCALALDCGDIGANWLLENEDDWIDQYKNIITL